MSVSNLFFFFFFQIKEKDRMAIFRYLVAFILTRASAYLRLHWMYIHGGKLYTSLLNASN